MYCTVLIESFLSWGCNGPLNNVKLETETCYGDDTDACITIEHESHTSSFCPTVARPYVFYLSWTGQLYNYVDAELLIIGKCISVAIVDTDNDALVRIEFGFALGKTHTPFVFSKSS